MVLYPGPIRGEPLAVELHNTIYAAGGKRVDGIADAGGLRAWLAALGDELPADTRAVDTGRLADFVELRAAAREALHAALEDRAIAPDAITRLNELSAGDPRSIRLTRRGRASELRHHAPTATDVLLGAIAASTIELVTGPRAAALRTCGAPGCVLMFLRDHPRREWCSDACGNRARQARHYERRKVSRRQAPAS